MRPRGTFGLCCVHILQLKTHSAVYTRLLNLQLCYKPLGIIRRVTTSQKVQISCLDVFQKLYNTNFAWHRSRGFLRDRVAKPEFRHSPISYLRTIKNNFSEIWESIHHIKWREGRIWASHIKTHCRHSCCNKIFQTHPKSDLHGQDDDLNENHNYITCLFILQVAH